KPTGRDPWAFHLDMQSAAPRGIIPADRISDPVEDRLMNFNLTVATRIGLNLLALLGVIIALRLGESIFIPLVIAVLLASILWPSAVRLNTFYRLPWPLACTAAVGTLVMINLFVVAGFVLSVPKLLQSVPNPNSEAAQQQ